MKDRVAPGLQRRRASRSVRPAHGVLGLRGDGRHRALRMQIDDAQVGIIRAHLRSQNVAGANNPLNLVGAAGAVLVSSLVQQGVIAAARGIEVYTPNQQNPPHTALAGGQPIRLWLSGGHFQAIVPG